MDSKPISHLESNAADIAAGFDSGQAEPVIITQDGVAKMVVMSYLSYQQQLARAEEARQQIALLSMLLQGEQDIAAGRTISAEEFLRSLDED